MITYRPPRHPGTTRSGRAFCAAQAHQARTTGSHRRTLLRLVALLSAATVGLTLSLFSSPPSSQAVAVPATPSSFGKALEAYPRYESESGPCSPSVKPGTAALAALIKRTYPGIAANTDSQCGSRPGPSSHDKGRAIDWMVNTNNLTQKAQATAFLNWLLKDNQAIARRLGVMYLIWDNKMFRLYDVKRGWTRYHNCPAAGNATTCHRDHVHISLTNAGGAKATSFWSGSGAGTVSTTSSPCQMGAN